MELTGICLCAVNGKVSFHAAGQVPSLLSVRPGGDERGNIFSTWVEVFMLTEAGKA